MKPLIHAQNSVKKYGGSTSDYLPIHNFMDSSKQVIADHRHRALFHHAFGCFVVEKVFGETITNTDGDLVSTRDIAEQHVLEDLGCIPTVEDYFRSFTMQPWMGGGKRNEVPSFANIESNENNDELEVVFFDKQPSPTIRSNYRPSPEFFQELENNRESIQNYLDKNKATQKTRSVDEIRQELFATFKAELVDRLVKSGYTHVQWTQYTPYFNDNYICEFSIGDIYGSKSEFATHDCDDCVTCSEEGCDECHGCDANFEERDDVDYLPWEDPLGKFICSGKESNILESLFGNHVKVIWNRANPDFFTTKSYDHE